MSKQCFVIMPFKQQGTAEHSHFRALFDNVIKPSISKWGYSVSRADDAKRVGSITKDIIVPLAEADLVVADLTDVNPNVFYELGVRHALRGYGTIMIMDETQTSIPFDITAYRVIRFKSTLEGIGVLGRELDAYVQQLEADPSTGIKDNLVHDWLPSLPTNVLQSSLGTEEGNLRRSVQELRKQIQHYEQKYGSLSPARDLGPDPLQVVNEALQEAKSGHIASTLVQAAVGAAESNDTAEYLSKLNTLLQLRTSKPSTRHLIELMGSAEMLGLDSVTEALITHAQHLYPGNRDLRHIQLQALAHSDNPKLRARARDEIAAELGITMNDVAIEFSREMRERDFQIYGLMLDAYHRDDLDQDALKVAAAAYAKYPDKSRIIRCYARALESAGDPKKSLELYKEAMHASDSDDTSAVWFGNELHNRNRHVDAAEAYLVACVRDPSDPQPFVHLADEIAWAMTAASLDMASVRRSIPKEISDSRDLVARALIAAVSQGGLNQDSAQRARSAAKRAEIDIEEITASLTQPEQPPTTRAERAAFAKQLLAVFRSGVTDAQQPLPV